MIYNNTNDSLYTSFKKDVVWLLEITPINKIKVKQFVKKIENKV